jgi:hypothetical protein
MSAEKLEGEIKKAVGTKQMKASGLAGRLSMRGNVG